MSLDGSHGVPRLVGGGFIIAAPMQRKPIVFPTGCTLTASPLLGSKSASGSTPRLPAVASHGDASLAAVFLGCTILNKLALRVALVPFGQFTHLLAVLTNLVYLAVFRRMFVVARCGGRVTQTMTDYVSGRRRIGRAQGNPQKLSIPVGGRRLLAVAGSCEATASLLQPLFASHLPGSMIPVMSQALLPCSMLFSSILLRKRYDKLQFVGVAIVISGVLVGSAGFSRGMDSGLALPAAAFLRNALGLFMGYAFLAFALLLKETTFARYSEVYGHELDSSVVTWHSATWQFVALVALWPFNFLYVTQLGPLPYFATAYQRAAVLQNAIVLLVYLIVNVCYSLATVRALKRLSSVNLVLTNVLSVPITSMLFCLNLPLLGSGPFSVLFVVGLFIIVLGLMVYHRPWALR